MSRRLGSPMLSGVAATVDDMTAAAEGPARRTPFAGASPSQIRDALRATESLVLTEVNEALDAWRRTAWLTSDLGHDGYYRAMLTNADQRARTGERAPGAVSWDELTVDLGLTDR